MNQDIIVDLETGKISYSDSNDETKISFRGLPPQVIFGQEDGSLNINTLYLIISQRCNLVCSYCYANDGVYDNAGLMETEIARSALRLLKNFATSNCTVVFFGGEPLLNFNAIKETVEYSEKLFKDRTVSYGIVTNGTVINDDIINFLRKYSFIVQVSVDGNETFHNKHRKSKDGAPTYRDIMKNVKSMKEAGVLIGVRVTLCHGNTDLKDFLRYCANDLGINVGFTPVRSDDRAMIFGKEDVDALCNSYMEMYDEVATTKDFIEILRNPFLSNMINACFEMENLPPAQINPEFCQAGKKAISVDISGNIYPCHTFIGYENFYMGNVDSPNIEKIEDFVEKAHWKNKVVCPDCFARVVCGGGCSHASYTANGDIRVPYKDFCEFMRQMFKLAIIFYVHMKKEELPKELVKSPMFLELGDLLLKR